MIIVSGHIDLSAERRDQALQAALPWMVQGRAQPGCLAYVFVADPIEAHRICVYEQWEDAASLTAHFAGPAYKGMLMTLSSFGLTGLAVRKHEVRRSEPVYGAQGPSAVFTSALAESAGA